MLSNKLCKLNYISYPMINEREGQIYTEIFIIENQMESVFSSSGKSDWWFSQLDLYANHPKEFSVNKPPSNFII